VASRNFFPAAAGKIFLLQPAWPHHLLAASRNKFGDGGNGGGLGVQVEVRGTFLNMVSLAAKIDFFLKM
jgi:hypothetical protein